MFFLIRNEVEERGLNSKMVEAYLDYYTLNEDEDAEDFLDIVEERYYGEYASEEDFAREYAEECGILNDVPDDFMMYFDYEAFARDMFYGDFDFCDGFVFSQY